MYDYIYMRTTGILISASGTNSEPRFQRWFRLKSVTGRKFTVTVIYSTSEIVT